MSADLLMRAAKVLREHVGNGPTDAPWVAAYDEQHDQHWVKGSHGATVGLFGERHTVAQYDTEYVALMHPPVALALADVLDSMAPLWAGLTVETEYEHEAIRLARAILREQP